MSELKELVVRAKAKDEDSYSEIVRRFQDMAYGYAYSMLGDHSQAEDAAQQAFDQANAMTTRPSFFNLFVKLYSIYKR